MNVVITTGFDSRGVLMDGEIYRDAFRAMNGVTVTLVPITDPVPAFVADLWIAIEDIGDEAAIMTLKNLRKKPYTVLIPNLEINSRWTRLLHANRNLVDLTVSKTAGLAPLIRTAFGVETAVVRHCTAYATVPMTSPSERHGIVHLCGKSPFKNTVQSVVAGLKLLDTGRYERMMIVVVPEYDEVRHMLGELRTLVNQDHRVTLVDTFLHEEEKVDVYLNSRLALCASESEGFGHYVLEAAAYGCQVITSDCIPMNEILVDQCSLAKVSRKYRKHHGVGCQVFASSIVEAESRLPDYDPELCRRNAVLRCQQFSSDFASLCRHCERRREQRIKWAI